MNKFDGGPAEIDATVFYFCSPGQVEWYWRLFRYPFWHVAIALHTAEGTIVIDPRMSYVSTRLCLPGTEIFPRSVRQRVRVKVDLSDPPWAFMIPGTCVSIVKAFLGLRAWWVLTPYQLYRYLGGRV